MKLLLDTNTVIPLEPTSAGNVEPNTALCAQLVNSASRTSSQLYVHPAQLQDLGNDPDPQRQSLRGILMGKYPQLPHPPPISLEIGMAIGQATEGSNDWVDDCLLAAVKADAVDGLVTEDLGVHRKAARLGIADRVLTLRDAIDALEALFEKPTKPPPAVSLVPAHSIDEADPIWDSFRADYPGFDEWLKRAKRAHRPCWIIEGDGSYAGVALLKPDDTDLALKGRVAKLCSLKVDEQQRGLRFGELLLKAVFNYTTDNGHDWIYVTAFEKQAHLIGFLEEFGFRDSGLRTDLGELILTKPLKTTSSAEGLRGLDLNIRFGPNQLDLDQPIYAIPIQPRYHRILFPDLETLQPTLVPGEHPFGNSIRKAYLCHSPSKQLQQGDVIAFYRSQDLKAITCLGVVEETVSSSDPAVIAAAVAKRTVYSYEQIEEMCRKEVLAILFRQSLPFDPPIRLTELVDGSMLKNAPMSIVRLPEHAGSWMKNRLRL